MGDQAAPSANESTAEMMKALTANLGPYMQTLSSQILPSEQAMQDASKVISPQQNQTQLDLLKQFGPQMNKVGTDIEGQNQTARATNDLNVLKGVGSDTVAATKALDQSLNPEFYKSRAAASDANDKLLGSFDLSGGLSGGERTEIERANNKNLLSRGVSGAPTGISAIENAMTFGNASNQRKQQNQAGMTSALNATSGFLPASRSGIDPLQTGLGRPSQGNVGQAGFQGFQQTGNQAYGLGQGLGQTIGGFQQQGNQINANRRTIMDYTNQAISSL